jgi:winged helix DNA-binding protein
VHVSWEQALAWRVAQQLLGDPVPRPGTPPPPAGSVVEAARRLAGVQAQVMSSAELALGVRTGAPPSATRTALQERRLTKTWAMRGTLHLFPSDELPTWVAALRAKEAGTRRTRGWEEYHGVTVSQLAAITGTVGDMLGRAPMTRVELAAAVTEATGDPALGTAVETGFGGTILKSAAANGDLCFGPDRGRNVTFVDPRLWLAGPWEEPEAGAALALVVRRFLDAYGPATEVDFARWWGVPPAQGKRCCDRRSPASCGSSWGTRLPG